MSTQRHIPCVLASATFAFALSACGSSQSTPNPIASDTGTLDEGADVVTIDTAIADADADASDADTTPRTALIARAEDGTTPTTHLVAIDLRTGKLQGELKGVMASARVHASGGRAFLLDGNQDQLWALDPAKPWTVAWTHTPASPDTVGPASAVAVAGTKAYVVRAGSNSIETLSLADGSHVGAIDLSAFVDPGDFDGIVEAVDAVYDASSARVYVVLQRTLSRDLHLGCIDVAPLIVGIDTATDMVVDLNGVADGNAIALTGARPQGSGVGFSLRNGSLFVLDAGCFDPSGTLVGAGIERVDVATGTVTAAATSALTSPLAVFLRLDDAHAYVRTAFPELVWRDWDPTKTTFAAVESALPDIAVIDGARVVGLSERSLGMASSDGGTTTPTMNTLDVVAFDPATQALTFVATDVAEGTSLLQASVVIP